MPFPRLRFTVRRMIVAVAVSAVFVYPLARFVGFQCRAYYYRSMIPSHLRHVMHNGRGRYVTLQHLANKYQDDSWNPFASIAPDEPIPPEPE